MRASVCGSVIVLSFFLLPDVAGEEGPLPLPAPAWKAVANGIDRIVVRSPDGAEEPFRLLAYRLDLSRFTVAAAEASAYGPGRTTALAGEMADRSRAVLAVNGPFFDENDRPLGLVVSGGRQLTPLRNADWGVLYVAGDRAFLTHTKDWPTERPADVAFAIQVGPRMIVQGQVLRLKNQFARRAALCIPPGGRSLVVVITESGIAESGDFAELLARAPAGGGLGCRDAVMLDGGPSAQLAVRAGGIRQDISEGRQVPIGIVFVPKAGK
jgi:uncharacterized protein YigE (DUF2233 family)